MKPIAEAIINGKREVVVELVKKALAANVPPATILNDGLIAGMNEVGRRFKANEFYVPEVLIAARAMSNAKEAATKPGAMEILQPYLTKAGVKSRGKVILGTVKGDLHDIGKNLVCMMLRGAGFEVIDLEIDVSPEKFVEAAKTQNVKLVGLSALLTTTMPQMKAVCRSGPQGRAEGRESDDRRRAGDAELRRRDRRAGLCSGRRIRRGQGEGTVRGRLISGCRRKRAAGRAAVAHAAEALPVFF